MDCLAASIGRLKSPLLQASRSRGAAQQSVAESGECGGGVPNQVILYICPSIYSTVYLHIYRLESRMEDDHRNLESRLMELERLVEANREKVAASTSFREVSSDESEDA